MCTNDPDANANKAEQKSFDLKTGSPKGHYIHFRVAACAMTLPWRAMARHTPPTPAAAVSLCLKPHGTALEVLWGDPKWVGIDGIVLLTDGSVLFNNVRENQLVRVEIKPGGTAGTVTQLQLSQPIDGPDGMRTLPDGRVILAENRAGKVDVVTIDDDKAKVDTIKDGFKLSSTAVTAVGDTAWVIETKFVYRNDPAFKDKDPGQFSATAVQIPKH